MNLASPRCAPSRLQHVVTAKAEGFGRIYTNDRRLLEACAQVGLEGIDPAG